MSSDKLQGELYQLLERIFDDQVDEVAQVVVEKIKLKEAREILADTGIDSKAFAEEKVKEIRLLERLVENGIEPPRLLAALSDQEYAQLTRQEVVGYLTAYGIDVPAVTNELVSQARGKLIRGHFASTDKRGLWDKLREGKRAVAASVSVIAMAAGVGALTVGGGNLATVVAFLGGNNTSIEDGVQVAALRDSEYGSSSLGVALNDRSSLAVPAANSDNQNAIALSSEAKKVDATSIYKGINSESSLVSLSADLSETVSTSLSNQVDPEISRSSFEFSGGDTLIDILAMYDVPKGMQLAVSRRLGEVVPLNSLRPGDWGFVFKRDGEFESLALFWDKTNKATVSRQGVVEVTEVGLSEYITVKGQIEGSLNISLTERLDEAAAHSIVEFLKATSGPIDFRSLPKGAAFEVTIKRIVYPNGEIGFGSVRRVYLDAGHHGTYVAEDKEEPNPEQASFEDSFRDSEIFLNQSIRSS